MRVVIEKGNVYSAEEVLAMLKGVCEELEKGEKVYIGFRERMAPAQEEANPYKTGEKVHPL